MGWLRAYDRGMRYAQRGGYTPGEQRRREQVRLRAAERFARGGEICEIAPALVGCWQPSLRSGEVVKLGPDQLLLPAKRRR